MKKIALLALAVVLVALLAGCAGGEEADQTPPVISGVSAQSITETSAVITWTTSEASTSQVEYGTTSAYGSTTTLDEDLVTSHSVSLPGLTAGTTYHYRVKSKDASGNQVVSGDYTFTTVAPPNETPNQPSNVSPADGASDVSLTPTLTSSGFSDPNTGDTHAASQWQITTTSGDYSSPVFDSGTDSANLTSITIPSGMLNNATAYYWRVRHQDDNDAWSDYSSETSFTTLIFPDENLEAAVREAIDKPEGPLHVTDIEGLAELDASERNIIDIRGLEYCANLIVLYLNGNQISDSTPLEDLTGLAYLNLQSNLITDITPMSGLTSLSYLNLHSNQISDIASLEDLASLTNLTLSNNQISDISPLTNLTNLTYLGLWGNQISDIAPVEDLTSLKTLYLQLNEISDITPMASLTSLTKLYLFNNDIVDISPLEGLTSLAKLYLNDNEIVDISPLEGLTSLEELLLNDNQISDITPLVNNAGLAEGDEVDLRGNPLSTESLNTLVPQLEARGVEVLYDAPPDGQLPTLQLGDRWVWTYAMGETTSTLIQEVIGEETVEGRNCYVIDMSFDPASTWTYDDVVCTATSMKHWADKATGLLSVKTESSYSCNGAPYTYTTTYSYNPWTSLFPLEVGKEVETENTTIQYSDGSQQGDPMVTTERYAIVSQENVTVAAGTFSCWKMTMYDSATDVTQTMWYSDQVKSIVKMIDAEGNTIMELQSYSVS